MIIKNLKIQVIILIFFNAIFSACQSSKTTLAESPSNQPPTLAGSMQGYKESLSRLLPFIIDTTQFNHKENKEKIDTSISSLIELSKQVVHSPVVQHMDPSMRFISNAFSDDLRRAQESIAAGKREYARYTLMNVTAYCIECHTRTSSGPTFNTPELEKTITSLKKMERGEFLLATRQFDRAFLEFENVMKENIASGGNLFELDRAVRYALSISIKYQRDAKKSLEVAKIIESSDKAPFYLRQSAHQWSLAIQEWKKEKVQTSGKPEDILKRSESLVRLGKNAQAGFSDRGGDVYFLRALSELHQVLAVELNKEHLGQALYLTGVSYEAVRDLSIWSLHEDYFESCIRQVPHSKWSERCYSKLEESIYFGYTGSAGVKLPFDIQLKLDQLQKLALPE
jgi:hypothetical protein